MEPLEDLGNDFFEMEDLLSGDTFLLYSPTVSKYETMGQMSMYFTLRSFNGQCYQTYGPITYFRGVQIFDVLFFARQLDSTVETYDELGALMQKDPLPFMTLLMGSEYPAAVHEGSLLYCANLKYRCPTWIYPLGAQHLTCKKKMVCTSLISKAGTNPLIMLPVIMTG